ncbi:MAG: YbgC/FadM family acyl-CoA thioesterase [Elusimicrobia bacterium]|nr:YbgC/FadM family acyl-CoA thioesterase [Elusimicrobiota bacterium]
MARTILVVDDDATLVAPLKDGLESAGYRVAVAFDAAQGLVLAHETRPDLIILDYYMPGGDGGSIYERLRAAPDTRETPVVFSTGLTLEELRGKVKGGARTFFLKKPVGFTGLLSVVNQVLGEDRRAISSVVLPSGTGTPPPAEPKPETAPEPRPAPAAEKAAAAPARPKGRHSEFEVRVSYADTDKLGVIYYANYLKYFEQGRTELLRGLGVRYRDLEIRRKLFLPAVEARVQYLAPSRYDDLLTVRTWIAELGRASVRFECDVIDKDLGGKVVARGYSRHAVVNDLWRSARIPSDLRVLLAPCVGRGPSA